MKTPTIWESASRPLFVRTVWLEGSELRPGLQRHFLLDYETRSAAERLTYPSISWQRKGKGSLKASLSCDFADVSPEDLSDDEHFHIDSAKAKLHDPIKPGTAAKALAKTLASRRRPSMLSRRFHSYESYYKNSGILRRTSDHSVCQSRRSSLHDINAEKFVAPDEKLAERVLNWLDLAGNEEFVKNLSELKEMEVKLTKTSKLRNDSIKRCLSKSANARHHSFSLPGKSKAQKLKSADALNPNTGGCHKSAKGAEAVKHITIIFNKEGQPIRFNRPAKNIDLCALSASPSTTRRMAGSLASARLYKSAENSRLNTERSRCGKLKEAGKMFSARRRLDTVADLTNSTLQKRLQENPLMGSFHSLHDSKKQLHIFMPTLPKKGLSVGLGCGGNEDAVSELSQNLSEYCKV